MPMFIITGSRMRQAISSPRSASRASKAAASLNGTTSGVLGHVGGDAGSTSAWSAACRGRRATSALGRTENITVSWWPWYEPSILTTVSRPVAARAMRMASIVASVPELANRTWSSSKRRQSSSASATVTGVGAAKWVPVGGRVGDGLDDLGMGVADDAHAEPAVEVGVLVAVDVPHLRAEAALDVDRVGIAGLERRRHAEGHRARGPARRGPCWRWCAAAKVPASASAISAARTLRRSPCGSPLGRLGQESGGGIERGHQIFTITCLSSV